MPKRENFFIPQITDDEVEVKEETVVQKAPSKPSYKPEGFVSSLYGKNVKDNSYYHGVEYGNGGRQYDAFRDKDKKINPDDYKDYIIQKDPNLIYQSAPTQQQSPQNIYQGAPIYEESFDIEDEEEDDIYYKNPAEEEFVNVNNNNNNFYNNNSYGNYNSRDDIYYNQPNNSNNNYHDYNQNDYSSKYSQSSNNYSQNGYNPNYSQRQESYYQKPQTERINVVVEEEQAPTYRKQQSSYDNQQSYQPEKTIKPRRKTKYVAPSLNLLRIQPKDVNEDNSDTLHQRNIIDTTLKQFSISGHVVTYTKGPTVTQFEVQLDEGVRFQKISSIQQNLQGNLKATDIRMQIPIPGKGTIGIEVPNVKRSTVFFGDMIANKSFLNDGNPMNVVLGVNIGGEHVHLDLAKMPHGLIAGSTGSGKSVCINAIIASILYKAHPDDVKLILVDPKRVEFSRYSGIPHLATPIINEPKMANAALKWAVEEMENRYRLFEATGVTKYTEYLEEAKNDVRLKHIPYLVIIIDELADLMMTAGNEVEESIMRITQKARAAGIHLIVATQRPSVNIISGTIKTNIPTKIAFRVNKAIDSNIIIDHSGAEKLLGNGDMLYTDDMGVENRIQGAFISSSEIKSIVQALENYPESEYMFTEEDLKKKTMVDHSDDALHDELFCDIARHVVENNNASINILQKKFSCGFSRIQAIIIKLGELGVVSENMGTSARKVLVNMAQLEEILNKI